MGGSNTRDRRRAGLNSRVGTVPGLWLPILAQRVSSTRVLIACEILQSVGIALQRLQMVWPGYLGVSGQVVGIGGVYMQNISGYTQSTAISLYSGSSLHVDFDGASIVVGDHILLPSLDSRLSMGGSLRCGGGIVIISA